MRRKVIKKGEIVTLVVVTPISYQIEQHGDLFSAILFGLELSKTELPKIKMCCHIHNVSDEFAYIEIFDDYTKEFYCKLCMETIIL